MLTFIFNCRVHQKDRASGDQIPWFGVRTQGVQWLLSLQLWSLNWAEVPSLPLLGSSPPTFGLKASLGLLVKGVVCPEKMEGFVKGVDCFVKYRGSFDLHS